jgi:hypothetical protein
MCMYVCMYINVWTISMYILHNKTHTTYHLRLSLIIQYLCHNIYPVQMCVCRYRIYECMKVESESNGFDYLLCPHCSPMYTLMPHHKSNSIFHCVYAFMRLCRNIISSLWLTQSARLPSVRNGRTTSGPQKPSDTSDPTLQHPKLAAHQV